MGDKKEVKKEVKKPEKKSKVPEVDLFNTPVYELTEDQIIQKGLKTKDPKDMMCYLGIAICFVFIFIPPIFDKVFDYTRPADTHVDVTYAKLSCSRGYFSDDKLTLTVNNEYRDSTIQKSTMIFTYDETEAGPTSDVTSWFAFEKTKGIKITKNKTNNKNEVTIEIDYKNNEELRDKPELADYSMSFMPQFNYYGGKSFFCSKETKTVNEDSAHPENNKENVWDETEDTK